MRLTMVTQGEKLLAGTHYRLDAYRIIRVASVTKSDRNTEAPLPGETPGSDEMALAVSA
jgi:hypothetical protein